MARKKRVTGVRESNVSQSLIVWMALAVIMLMLGGSVYAFGFDMGFVQVSGHLGPQGLMAGAIICVILSYFADILFIRTARRFFDAPISWITYIPYVGILSLFDSWGLYLGWACVGVAVLTGLAGFTSLGQFLPTSVIQTEYYTMAAIIIVAMAVFTVIRGIYCMLIKRDALKIYNTHINDNFGSGGSTAYFSYAVYFIPIMRMISLYTDINLLRNIKLDLDSMAAQEE